MPDSIIAGLSYLASLVTMDDFDRGAEIPLPDSAAWHEEEGLRFCDLTKTDFGQGVLKQAHRTSGFVLGNMLGDVAITLTEVTGRVRPHRHDHSSAVLRCVHADPKGSRAYVEFGDGHFWYPACEDQLFVIECGAYHGFEQAAEARQAFFLLGFEFPGIADDDTFYKE